MQYVVQNFGIRKVWFWIPASVFTNWVAAKEDGSNCNWNRNHLLDMVYGMLEVKLTKKLFWPTAESRVNIMRLFIRPLEDELTSSFPGRNTKLTQGADGHSWCFCQTFVCAWERERGERRRSEERKIERYYLGHWALL